MLVSRDPWGGMTLLVMDLSTLFFLSSFFKLL